MKTAAPYYYHLDVEISPERIGHVRRILAAHLRYWDLEMLVEPVCRCSDALLRTIDAHAADKNATIEMWWNGHHLITAVQDSERDIRPHYAPSGCLAQIAALSNGWGCCATDTGARSSGSRSGTVRRSRPARTRGSFAEPAGDTSAAPRPPPHGGRRRAGAEDVRPSGRSRRRPSSDAVLRWGRAPSEHDRVR